MCVCVCVCVLVMYLYMYVVRIFIFYSHILLHWVVSPHIDLQVLRLMCLQSQSNGGLKPKLMERYRWEIIQVSEREREGEGVLMV